MAEAYFPDSVWPGLSPTRPAYTNREAPTLEDFEQMREEIRAMQNFGKYQATIEFPASTAAGSVPVVITLKDGNGDTITDEVRHIKALIVDANYDVVAGDWYLGTDDSNDAVSFKLSDGDTNNTAHIVVFRTGVFTGIISSGAEAGMTGHLLLLLPDGTAVLSEEFTIVTNA